MHHLGNVAVVAVGMRCCVVGAAVCRLSIIDVDGAIRLRDERRAQVCCGHFYANDGESQRLAIGLDQDQVCLAVDVTAELQNELCSEFSMINRHKISAKNYHLAF